MKSSSNFCIFLIIVYTLFLVFCLLNEIACMGYYTIVFDKETRALLPEKMIFPEYDKNGEVKNANEVTAWEFVGFVPEKYYKVHNYFSWIADIDVPVWTLILVGLFLPMLICYKRTETKPYLPIALLMLIFAIAWFIMPRVCGG